jgi:toxin co-regulated pilin
MNQMMSKLKQKANMYAELKKQRGMSLLEIIIVLGIIGVMAAGVVVLAQRAFAAQDITDIVSNTNTVRTSTVDAFSNDGEYPLGVSVTDLTATNIKTGDSAAIASTLVKMGKISPAEVRNGISGDYYYMAGLPIGTSGGTTPVAGKRKGFALVVNGLDQAQCRNILSQLGNEWDYVSVINAPAGMDPTLPTDLSGAAAPLAAAANTAILKSFLNPINITSATVAFACADNSTNGIVLGSK